MPMTKTTITYSESVMSSSTWVLLLRTPEPLELVKEFCIGFLRAKVMLPLSKIRAERITRIEEKRKVACNKRVGDGGRNRGGSVCIKGTCTRE